MKRASILTDGHGPSFAGGEVHNGRYYGRRIRAMLSLVQRIRTLRRWAIGACFLSIGLSCSEPPEMLSPVDPTPWVLAAGNASSEEERYRRLTELRASLTPADEAFAGDLDRLLEVVDRWANGLARYWEPGDQALAGEGGYLGGFFVLRIVPNVDNYPPRVAEDSPLYPLWCLYRGRMLIWHAVEMGFLPDEAFAEGRACLQVAAETFPENEVIGMYLDAPIRWPRVNPVLGDAPDWANLQRESLEKLYEIISFWMNERQAPDGQFGGGWGDDVEMWRHWAPILIGFEEPPIREAHTRLAEGIFALPRLTGGYTNILTDVEHSSEDTGDTLTSMLLLEPMNALWAARADRLAELMQDQWTATNEQGLLQFRSTYFTPTEVDNSPEHACDTAYHLRAMHPAMLLWQQGSRPEYTELFTRWMDNWVAVSERASRGKPAGIVPSSVSYPSGQAGGPGRDWWNPGCHYTDTTFAFPRAMSLLMRALVLTYEMSGEANYLTPLRSMVSLREAYRLGELEDDGEGGAHWAASRIGGALRDALGKYRALTGSTEFDDFLRAESDGYLRYRIDGDEDAIRSALADSAAAFAYNRPAYTDEVRFTDRVFRFHRRYASAYVDPALRTFDAELIYGMVTGDLGDPMSLPLPAVRWRTSPEDLAVWVKAAGPDVFRAELFHFGDSDRPLRAFLLQLLPGSYRWTLRNSSEILAEGELTMTFEGEVDFFLPPNQLVEFECQPLR